MKKEQILKKAIEKAVKNGYDVELSGNGNIKVFNGKERAERIVSPIEFIFSHDFAKAVFGEEKDSGKRVVLRKDFLPICHKVPSNRGWQYHLQQMVLEKDPIKYLEKFI